MALLGFVNEGDCLVRQPEQHFLLAGRRNAAPVGPDVFGDRELIGLHDANPVPIYL
jgi:hypothetical protein